MTAPIDSSALALFILERVAVGVFTVDREMKVLQFNKYMEAHTGVSEASLLGRELFECFPELPKKWLAQKIRGVVLLKNFAFTSWKQRPYLFPFAHNRPITGGIDLMLQDVTFVPVKDAAGEVVAVCVTVFDATDACLAQRAAEEASEKLRVALAEVERLSVRDGLTGILNRRALDARFNEEVARFLRYRSPLALVLLDVDHFKKVNDTHGHLGGDEVLRCLAAMVSSEVRDVDIFGRYGGEELAVVLPGVGLQGAAVVAERVRARIEANPVAFGGGVIPVTVSIGVTEAREGTTDASVMIAEADGALYACKRWGRNRVICHPPPGAGDAIDNALGQRSDADA